MEHVSVPYLNWTNLKYGHPLCILSNYERPYIWNQHRVFGI